MSDGFFLADLADTVTVGDTVTLSGREGHHASVVRRIAVGERVTLADGHGLGVRGPVTATRKDGLDVQVDEVLHAPAPRPRFVCVQAIPKNDRVEQAIDLLTEVGVDEIVPWQASRSIVRWQGERGEKAHAKWVTTAREAAKQSRRLRVPEVAPLATTAEVAERLRRAECAYALHESATTAIVEQRPAGADVVFVIGPEGGIAPDELAAFEAAGAIPVLMGETVLRTSTAGGVALVQLRLLTELGRGA